MVTQRFYKFLSAKGYKNKSKPEIHWKTWYQYCCKKLWVNFTINFGVNRQRTSIEFIPSNVGFVCRWDTNLTISVSADAVAPNNAIASADILLTVKLDILFKFSLAINYLECVFVEQMMLLKRPERFRKKLTALQVSIFHLWYNFGMNR